MSKAACKTIIDSGGRNGGLALSLNKTLETMATSLTWGGVAETKSGELWLRGVKGFHEKTLAVLEGLNKEAMEWCMTQPLA